MGTVRDGTTYVSIPDFWRMFGLGRSPIYNMLAGKELRAIKAGDRTLLDVENANAHFASQRAAEFRPKAA